MSTSSLIDHIFTNTPEKISDAGVIHTGISDHSLVFAIRKISVIKKQEHTVEIRNMKNFNDKNLSLNCRNRNGNMCIFLRMIQMPCGRCGKECF